MIKKIIFSAGGTGGHIFPALNLMNHFFDKGYQVLLVTDDRGKFFFKKYSKFKFYILKTDTPINKNIFKKILSLIMIFLSIIKSFYILRKEKPDLIFGFGGYVSFPIAFLSKFFKLPLIIYEDNVALGKANKYLAPFSKKILTAKKIADNFSDKNKSVLVGSILNKNIINYTTDQKSIIKENFSILVLGGSQGAEIFGKLVPCVIKKIKDQGYSIEVNQQCVASQKANLIEFYEKSNIKNYVFEFEKNILKLLISSDLALTRCGANTTAELTHTLTPFIAVPIPHSVGNHQYLNAKYYENKGCCWILEQNDFNSENLFSLIVEAIKNKQKLENIKENMKKNKSKDVYKDIENVIKEFI